MDWVGEVLYTAFMTVVVVAVLVVLGLTAIVAIAGLMAWAMAYWAVAQRSRAGKAQTTGAWAMAYWAVAQRIMERCAGCWRCVIARGLVACSVFGGVPAAAFIVWVEFGG